MNLLSTLDKLAEQFPDLIALQGQGISRRYPQLRDDVIVLADWLTQNKRRVVALLADNHPEWVVVDLACQLANVMLLPLPLYFTESQRQHAMQSVGADTLLYSADLSLPKLPAAPLSSLRAYALPFAPVPLPEACSKITFTSGSTGTPKGVCLSQAQQWQVAEALVQRVALTQVRHLSVLPLATLLENIAGVYAPLLVGGTVCLPSLTELGWQGSSALHQQRWLSSLRAWQPESMILIPQLLEQWLNALHSGAEVLNSLQFVAVGGAKVSPGLLAEARSRGIPVYEGYGLSECASVVALNAPLDIAHHGVGKPLPGVRVHFDDGEILVEGRSFLGYVGEPGSWYPRVVRTGDLGRLDSEGYLHIDGRRKNVLISSFGRNISPEWIEAELQRHPAIVNAVLFGDSRPYCVALLFSSASKGELQPWLQALNQTLPDYAQVRDVLIVSPSPEQRSAWFTDNGRPRRAIIAEHFQAAIDCLYSHPTTTEVSA